MKQSNHEWQSEFLKNCELHDEKLDLQLGGASFRIRSNSKTLLDNLTFYFKHLVYDEPSQSKEIIAVETSCLNLGLPFTDWQREAGKQGRKDAFFDLEDGRLILKIRTGMIFLQSQTSLLAIGPCEANPNQVINFINSQFMNHWMPQGFLICHASCVEISGHGLAIAGLSGGGKSTLMLEFMELENSKFVSNDRLFIRLNEELDAYGLPKLPRINPGTIVNNKRLRPMLTEEQITEIEAMPSEALWKLEEKYDADVESLYGKGRIIHQTILQVFIILNWDLHAKNPTKIHQVDLADRTDLLKSLMKTPGPFYQDAEGQFLMDNQLLSEELYLNHLKPLKIYEVTGKMDFQSVKQYFQEGGFL